MNDVLGFVIVVIYQVLNILSFAIIARVLLSWFAPGHGHSLGRLSEILHDVTEPILQLVQKIPHRIGMIDLSPLMAILFLDFLKILINQIF